MGFTGSAVVPHDFNLLHLTDPLSNPVVTFGLGCAKGPIVAAAAPTLGGFLVAFSSGSDFKDPGCQGGGGAITAATHLSLVRVDNQGSVTPVATIGGAPGAGSIAAVQIVHIGDDDWIAWTHQPGNGSPLLVMHIDAKAQMVNGPFEIPFSGDPASLSAARLGDQPALAWASTEVDVAPRVRVSVLGGSGVVADVAITLGPSATATGRTALLGSPSGDALLVSWVEIVSFTRQLRTARISCSLP
jgi:hypothetical protein